MDWDYNANHYYRDGKIMKMIEIKKEDLNLVWKQASDILAKAFKPNQIYTLDDIYSSLERGESQLWCVYDNEMIGSLVTSVDEGSRGRVCNIIKLAGKRFKEWGNLMESTLNNFAKLNKCESIEALTRVGFSKVLPSFKKQKDVLLIRKVA